MSARLSGSLRRLAAACLDQAAKTQPEGLEPTSALQTVSRTLTASAAHHLDKGRAHALCTLGLTLAKRDFAFLASVDAAADGTLTGISSAVAGRPVDEVQRAAVAIVAHHLRLLATLTDEQTMTAIVSDLLPNARPA